MHEVDRFIQVNNFEHEKKWAPGQCHHSDKVKVHNAAEPWRVLDTFNRAGHWLSIERTLEQGRRRIDIMETVKILKDLLPLGDHHALQHDATRRIAWLHGVRVPERQQDGVVNIRQHSSYNSIEAETRLVALSQAHIGAGRGPGGTIGHAESAAVCGREAVAFRSRLNVHETSTPTSAAPPVCCKKRAMAIYMSRTRGDHPMMLKSGAVSFLLHWLMAQGLGWAVMQDENMPTWTSSMSLAQLD